MLYKVTPMMPTPEEARKAARKAREPGQPRKRRKTAVYDADGNEVLITLMCLKCKGMKPLAQFGLRRMADGAIRNQPWCRTCRGAASVKKKPAKDAETTAPVTPLPQAEVAVAEATPAAFDEQTQPAAPASPDAGVIQPLNG